MEPGLISGWVTRGIVGAGEAMFPENDYLAPDWRSTELVSRTFGYLDELPPAQRRLLLALFVVTELLGGWLAARPRRFSKLSVASREQAIRGWRASRHALLRMLGDSLKAVLTMPYASHPSVLVHLGEYRSCAHPGDGLPIPHVPDALVRQGAAE